jgi:hypothetical protein
MLRAPALVSALVLSVSTQAAGQNDSEHVWSVNELRAHPGQEATYLEAIQRFDIPIGQEVIRRGKAVSQLLLVKQAGKMEDGTHLLIIEYATWDDYIHAAESLDEASRSLFGRPYDQLAEEEYMPLRDVIRRDVYLSPPPAM